MASWPWVSGVTLQQRDSDPVLGCFRKSTVSRASAPVIPLFWGFPYKGGTGASPAEAPRMVVGWGPP